MGKSVNLYYCLFFCILGLIFIGALTPALTFISLISSAILAFCIGKYYIRKPSVDVCIGIIYLLVFQNFCIGIGAHFASNTDSSLKYLTQIPFLVIAIIWVIQQFIYIKDGKIILDKTKKSFILLLICILFSMLIGRGNIQSILVNFRNLTTFYMAYEIGKNNLNNSDNLKFFIERFLRIAKLMLLAGIAILILGDEIYIKMGIKEVYIAKGSPILNGNLDGRFYTTLISKQYMRMGSLYYEPVNLAYFFAIAFIVSIFYKREVNKINTINTIILMGIGLLLTYGKGGYLIVGTVFLCIFVQKFFEVLLHKLSKRWLYIMTVIIIIFIISVFCIFYYKNIGAAATPHFWGVIRTWKSVLKRPYGHGLGTGGNMAQVFNSDAGSWLETGGETALMSFMYQIGIQGVLALLLCMYRISINKINKKLDIFYRVFSFIPIVLLGISLLQDNTFSPQCIIPFMLLQGAAKINTENDYIIQ